MKWINEDILSWFEESSRNDEDVLSFELLSCKSNQITIRCGEETLSITHQDMSSDNAVSLEYGGDDDFFINLISKTTRLISSRQSSNIIEVLEILSSQANEIYGSMMKDDGEDAYNMDDDNNEDMEDTSQHDHVPSNDIFRPMTHEEEIKLKQRLTDKIALLKEKTDKNEKKAGGSNFSSSSLAAPTEKKKDIQSIFSAGTSSMILVNEFLNINKSCREDGIIVEAIDDSVFSWRVRFYKFKGDSDLSVDLIALDEIYGYNYIEIVLNFAADIYPFYPPTATIIRPRLKGLALSKISSMKCLQFSSWDPVCEMKSILTQIQLDIELNSRLDVESDLNDIHKHPDGSYSQLEHLLFKFGMVTEIPSRISESEINRHLSAMKVQHSSKDEEDLSKRRKINSSSSSSSSSSKTSSASATASAPSSTVGRIPPASQTYWAKGTGYGHGSRSASWDVNQYKAAKAEKDRLQQHILDEIAHELERFHQPLTSSTSSSSSSSSTDTDLMQSMSTTSSYNDEQRFLRILEESSLIPFIELILTSHTMLEMESQYRTYQEIFMIIEQLVTVTWLQPLLLPLDRQVMCIAELLELMKHGLSIYNRISTSSTSKSKIHPSAIVAPLSSTSAVPAASVYGAVEIDAKYFLDVIEKVEAVFNVYQVYERSHSDKAPSTIHISNQSSPDILSSSVLNSSTAITSLKSAASSTSASDTSNEEQYVTMMREHQYTEVDNFESFHYSSYSNMSSKSRVRRLAQDHSDLSCNGVSLLSWSSSVWVRAWENRMDCMRVMISGPDGTPYSNGLFIFDVYFPDTYPTKPPQVNLCTTGRGAVRFNPNLYNCGKVCLSLLGTWAGDPSESWHEGVSTFRQVLLSIQSLILVPEPYFNEPSYEASMHTSTGRSQSKAYNANIREQTARWAMLDHLENLKKEFNDAIQLHFRLKREEIEAQLLAWTQDGNGINPATSEKLLALLRSL